MFGAYSFINVAHGKEEFDNSHSLKNMVEVAVVSKIVARLFKGMYKFGTNPSLSFAQMLC